MAQHVMKITFSKFHDFSSNCQKWSDGHLRAPVGPSNDPQRAKMSVKSMTNQTFSNISVKLAPKPRKAPQNIKFICISLYISYVFTMDAMTQFSLPLAVRWLDAKSMRNHTFYRIDIKLVSKPSKTQNLKIREHPALYFICFYSKCNDSFLTPPGHTLIGCKIKLTSNGRQNQGKLKV